MYALNVPLKYVTAFMAITVYVCTQQKDTLFQQFLIAVSLEGLENKYSLELRRGQIKYSISDVLLWSKMNFFIKGQYLLPGIHFQGLFFTFVRAIFIITLNVSVCFSLFQLLKFNQLLQSSQYYRLLPITFYLPSTKNIFTLRVGTEAAFDMAFIYTDCSCVYLHKTCNENSL